MTELLNTTDMNRFITDGASTVQVVVCVAQWSRVCRNLQLDMSTFADNYESVRFATVDVDKCYDIKKKHTVASVPTWLIFKNNELHDELSTTNQYLVNKTIQKFL